MCRYKHKSSSKNYHAWETSLGYTLLYRGGLGAGLAQTVTGESTIVWPWSADVREDSMEKKSGKHVYVKQ